MGGGPRCPRPTPSPHRQATRKGCYPGSPRPPRGPGSLALLVVPRACHVRQAGGHRLDEPHELVPDPSIVLIHVIGKVSCAGAGGWGWSEHPGLALLSPELRDLVVQVRAGRPLESKPSLFSGHYCTPTHVCA